MSCTNCSKQRELIAHMNLALRKKNRELDALHYVWCSGGCESGTHRWSMDTITEEVVQDAEKNTQRLRLWWETKKLRSVKADNE